MSSSRRAPLLALLGYSVDSTHLVPAVSCACADTFELKKRALHVYGEKQRVPDFRWVGQREWQWQQMQLLLPCRRLRHLQLTL